VFHLAAQTIVGKANESPLPTFEANVRGTYMLLEACRVLHEPIERIVVASPDRVYGSHGDVPYEEDFAPRPRHPYGVSKACADLIA
jgi:CDP-glucose 4,6-dehydratase